MNAKILLIAFSAAAFSSCSTAYKSGQTPDDVYYSPVRVVEESRKEERYETRREETTADDARIRMQIRDRRWRNLNDDYDYNSYNNSPYNYCNCNCTNYGYYYNPFYAPRPLYYAKVTPQVVVNSTPRMTNLNSYKNYSSAVNTNPKTGVTTRSTSPRQYNNSNNGSRVGNVLREVFTPSANTNTNSNNNANSNNNTRTYTPRTTPSTNNSSSSSSSGSSSSGSSSGGSVSRPSRGG